MVRRIILLIVVLILSLFVAKTPLYSQEPSLEPSPSTSPGLSELTFDQVYAEYINSTDEYNKARGEYLLRRSQYLKFDSLQSEKNAFDATLLMLEKRDDVVISYLNVLRVKLKNGIGISGDRRDGLYLRMDDEAGWFTNHRDNLSTTGSLDDLVSDSNLARSRWARIDPLAYEIMAVLSQGKITKFSARLEDVFSDTDNKLEVIRNDEREGYSFSSYKFQTLDRWVFEADGKIVRSKEKQDEARLLIESVVKTKKSAARNYNQIVAKLTETQLYMNEAVSFIKEIIKQIKIAE